MKPKNFILSPEKEKQRRKKISETMKKKGINPNGRNPNPGKFIRTPETLKKMSKVHIGQISCWKGKKNPNLSLRNKLNNPTKSGKSHWNWKGGITKLNKLIRHSKKYEQWRSDIFKRDNWTCQTWGKRSCYLEAHHIKEFHLILKENKIFSIEDSLKCKELWSIENGVTLCKYCHNLTKRGRV